MNINEAAWIQSSWMLNIKFQIAIFQKPFKIIWCGFRQSPPYWSALKYLVELKPLYLPFNISFSKSENTWNIHTIPTFHVWNSYFFKILSPTLSLLFRWRALESLYICTFNAVLQIKFHCNLWSGVIEWSSKKGFWSDLKLRFCNKSWTALQRRIKKIVTIFVLLFKS